MFGCDGFGNLRKTGCLSKVKQCAISGVQAKNIDAGQYSIFKLQS